MKKALFILAVALLTSCTSFKQIGDFTMVSTRNVESDVEYKLLRSYAGSSTKELRKSRALTMEEAINITVRNTPGGEFMKNVKIYVVNGRYYAVEGDVWGTGTPAEQDHNGFKVGDVVQYNRRGKQRQGTIITLTNSTVCTVKENETGIVMEIKYKKLFK